MAKETTTTYKVVGNRDGVYFAVSSLPFLSLAAAELNCKELRDRLRHSFPNCFYFVKPYTWKLPNADD